MPETHIVAIGLLTERDLERLGDTFRGAIPVSGDSIFDDLLEKLDSIEVEPFGHGIMLRPDRTRQEPSPGANRD